MTDILDELHMASWTFCVADLEVSKRFYCEGLGFKEGRAATSNLAPGTDIAKAFDLPNGGTIHGVFISRPDVRMRLVYFEEPKAVGGRGRKPTNQIGPRCMIFICPNPKGVAERLEKLGGKIVHESRGGAFETVFVTDPDGFSLQIEALAPAAFDAAFQKQG